MATLNLRKVPDELKRSLKMGAAEFGLTLEEFCVRKLSQPMGFGAAVGLKIEQYGKVVGGEGIQDRGSAAGGITVRGFVHKVAQAKRQGESAARVGVERVDEESQSGLVPESVRDEEAVDEEPVSEVWPADGVGKVGVVEVSGKEGLRVPEAVAELSDEDIDLEPELRVVCVACEGKLDPFKDKMVCSDAGCGMRGVAQKGRKV